MNFQQRLIRLNPKETIRIKTNKQESIKKEFGSQAANERGVYIYPNIK